MKIKIDCSSIPPISPYYLNTCKKAALSTLCFFSGASLKRLVGPTNHFHVSISLVGTVRMKSLNNQYRKKNKPTDVLSFPGITPPQGLKQAKTLGDIIVCLPQARAQAREYGEPLGRELERLVVHGMLHLLGFDHEKNKKEERKMFLLQDKILQKLSKKHLLT